MSDNDQFEAFVQWVEHDTNRLIRTAVHRLLNVLDPKERSLEWAEHHANELANRLPNVSASSRVTYASRLRGAIRQYQRSLGGPASAPVPVQVVAAPVTIPLFVSSDPPPRSLEQQLEQAYAAIGRWPALRPYLAEALGRAELDLREGKLGPSAGTPIPVGGKE